MTQAGFPPGKPRAAWLAGSLALAGFGAAGVHAQVAPLPGTVTDLGQLATGGNGPVTAVVPSLTGDRAQSRAAKRLAPNLVEVQPQSEIRKLPDVNIAEALQRLPGITLEIGKGEGRFVNTRGLDADLGAVTYGTVRLLPTNPAAPFAGGRAIALDTFPASFVGGLVLTKSLRPDQDAEGLAGQIEIVPRPVPTDGRLHLELRALGGFETLASSPVVGGDVTLSGNFGYLSGTRPWDPQGAPALPGGTFFTNPRPFSFVITNSNYNDQRGIEDSETQYNDGPGVPPKLLTAVDLRRYDYYRRRYGRGGEFQYKPNDYTSFFVRYIETGYNENLKRHSLVLSGLDSALPCAPLPACTAGPQGVGFTAPNATADQNLRFATESLQNRVVTWGGDNLIGDRLRLDYHGAFSEGSYDKPYDYNAVFGATNTFPLAYDNATYARTIFTPLAGTNLADPANYAFSSIARSRQAVRDREWSGVVNAALPLDLGAATGTIKAGGSVRLRQRTGSTSQQSYTTSLGLPFAAYATGPSQTFEGLYPLGPRPSLAVIGLIGSPATTLANTVLDGSRTAASIQDNRENIYAWYGQYEATVGKLGVLAGIRFEKTAARYGANTVSINANGSSFSVTPAVNKQSYLDYFPTVQLRYEIDRTLIGRLAYSTAIARPGFNQVTAATTVDVGAQTVTTGNPSLKPTTADAFDLSFEKYLPNGGIVSAGMFGKLFRNYILQQASVGTYPGISGVTRINSFTGSGSAYAYGVELAYTQRFTFLPAPFDGLGIDANYTYVQSGVQLRPGEADKPLPSTSAHNFNLAGIYEKDRVTFRIAAAYTSRNLFAVGASRALDIFAQPRLRLDLGAGYRLRENFELFTQAKNLTDEPITFTLGSSAARPVEREISGLTFLAGARATF